MLQMNSEISHSTFRSWPQELAHNIIVLWVFLSWPLVCLSLVFNWFIPVLRVCYSLHIWYVHFTQTAKNKPSGLGKIDLISYKQLCYLFTQVIFINPLDFIFFSKVCLTFLHKISGGYSECPVRETEVRNILPLPWSLCSVGTANWYSNTQSFTGTEHSI